MAAGARPVEQRRPRRGDDHAGARLVPARDDVHDRLVQGVARVGAHELHRARQVRVGPRRHVGWRRQRTGRRRQRGGDDRRRPHRDVAGGRRQRGRRATGRERRRRCWRRWRRRQLHHRQGAEARGRGAARLLPLDHARLDRLAAGPPTAAHLMVPLRRRAAGGGGALRRLRRGRHRHVADGAAADHRAHPVAVDARALVRAEAAAARGAQAPASPHLPAHRRLARGAGGRHAASGRAARRDAPARRARPGCGAHSAGDARALRHARRAGAARLRRADPRRHSMGRDVARGARAGLPAVLHLRGARRRRHDRSAAAARAAPARRRVHRQRAGLHERVRRGAAQRDGPLPRLPARRLRRSPAAAGVGALLRRAAQPRPRAAADEGAAAAAGLAQPAARAQPRAGGAGHVPRLARGRRDQAVRAVDQGDELEAAAAPAGSLRLGRRRVRLPAQGARGPAPGRACDAALRAGQHAAQYEGLDKSEIGVEAYPEF